MKIRGEEVKHLFINKKTGAEARVIAMYLDPDGVMQVDGYDTVEDLMDDYAAYEKYEPPKEPLIKDERIRKAVRAWAELNNIQSVTYDEVHQDRGLNVYMFEDNENENVVIQGYGWIPTLEEGESYTIAELCGEEEE